MTFHRFFNSKRTLWLVLLSIWATVQDSSQTLTKTISDLKKSQPCQTAALSTFIPSISPTDSLNPFESPPPILDICPNLRYSCCQEEQLKGLIEQLKQTFKFLNYRGELMNEVFTLIGSVPEDRFRSFLSELGRSDVECYNSIQNDIIDAKLAKFSDKPELLKVINQRRKHVQFDLKKLMSSFQFLKDNIKSYVRKMRNTYSNREKYYSGMVCSMCSSKFSHQFELGGDGKPFLEINRDMCNQIIMEKLEFIISIEIFPFLQKIIDIVYCRRKNPKSNKNYGSLEWKDLNLIVFDLETIPEYKTRRNECIQNDSSYVEGPDGASECVKYCEGGLGFFELRMVSMKKFIRVENELHNMFVREMNSAESASERLESQINKYYLERDRLINAGLLEYNSDSQIETMWYIKSAPKANLDFTKSKITVTNYLGLQVAKTPMNPAYYKWAFAFKSMLVFVLLALSY